MFKIDVPEVLAWLASFLYTEDLPARELAIIELFHSPSDAIKPVLFTFFSVESDLSLLEKAGSLFEINQDPEVPYRLLEIAEPSSSEKAQLIKGIIRSACNLLQGSGLLQDRFDAYLSQFQTWANRRNSQRFLQEILLKLKTLPEAEWSDLEPAGGAVPDTFFRDDLEEGETESGALPALDAVSDRPLPGPAFLAFRVSGFPTGRGESQVSASAPTAMPGQSIIGIIGSKSIQPYGVHDITAANEEFLVVEADDRLMKANPGQKFEIEVPPMKICPDGVIMARCKRVLQEFLPGTTKRKP